MTSMISNIYGRIVGILPPPERNQPKILCVGQSCLDIVQLCRDYPEEDEDVRCINFRYQRGGNASNSCTVLSQLGRTCEFFGFLSNQISSTFLQEDMRKHEIDFSHCPMTDSYECPKSVVILSMSTGSRTIIHHNPNFPEVTLKDFVKLDLDDYSWIHFEGRNVPEVISMMQHVENYNKSIAQQASGIADPSINRHPITISVELEKIRDELIDLLPYVDAAFISKEFARSRGYANMSETLRNISRESKTGATIFSAWADLGAMARTPDGTIVQSPAFSPDKVVDTLGAGDTFNAAVIYYLNKQKLAYQKNGSGINDQSVKNNIQHNYNIESSERSQTEFINREVLQDAITFGCRLAGAKIGLRGLDCIRSIHKRFLL